MPYHIAVPTGIEIFRWLTTICGSTLRYRATCLWATGFVYLFIIRRITGRVHANISIDIVLHGNYYTVARFHYILSLTALFAIIAGCIQWFSIFTGLATNPKWLKGKFAAIVTGINITVFPQHFPVLAAFCLTNTTVQYVLCKYFALEGVFIVYEHNFLNDAVLCWI